jgi:hypothetical protein
MCFARRRGSLCTQTQTILQMRRLQAWILHIMHELAENDTMTAAGQPLMTKKSADAASGPLARPVLVAGAARLGPLLAAAYLTELQVLLRVSADSSFNTNLLRGVAT